MASASFNAFEYGPSEAVETVTMMTMANHDDSEMYGS